jgi:hypothetical protein
MMHGISLSNDIHDPDSGKSSPTGGKRLRALNLVLVFRFCVGLGLRLIVTRGGDGFEWLAKQIDDRRKTSLPYSKSASAECRLHQRHR